MFHRIWLALKLMWADKREACYIALGYVAWIFLFYIIGATKAQFAALVAVVVLTGLYAAGVWFVKKYLL